MFYRDKLPVFVVALKHLGGGSFGCDSLPVAPHFLKYEKSSFDQNSKNSKNS
jgi:hypothetical protein